MSALDFNANDHPPLEPIENIKARTDIIDIVGRHAAPEETRFQLPGQVPRSTSTARPAFR